MLTRLEMNSSFVVFAVVGIALLLVHAFPCRAAFVEQFAISSKAISLANTVTAYPPGHMSVHYNPAGLSKLKEGRLKGESFTFAKEVMLSKFEADPNFKGFMDTWGPQFPKNEENDWHALYQSDPLDGLTAKVSGREYLPFAGPINLPFLVGPSLGISYRAPGSKWTFCYGNYPPFAVGYNRADDDPGRFGGKSAVMQHLIYAAPSVSYQVNRRLAVGLSVGLGQTAMGAEVDMRTPNELVALTRVLGETTKDLEIPVLSELTLPPPWFGGGISPYEQVGSMEFLVHDDFSPSFNLGVLWEPRDWVAFGVCYQSPIKAKMTGRYQFNYGISWQKMQDWMGSSPLLLIVSGMFDLPHQAVPIQGGKAVVEFELPRRVQMGVMFRPIKKLRLMWDLHWAQWSVIKQDKIEFDQDIQMFRVAKMLGYTGGDRTMILPRNFVDTWHWSAGMEYQVTDKLCVRFGYEFRPTSVQADRFDMLYHLPDLTFLGAGIGLTTKKGLQLDLGFGYMFNKGYKVPNNSSHNLNSTTFTDIVYNPLAGLNYEQDLEIFLLSVGITKPF